MKSRRRFHRTRQGTATVELAVLAPFLLTIVVGIVEVSSLFETHNILATAAREGARYATMDRSDLAASTSTNAKIVTDVKSFLEASGINKDVINVKIVAANDSGMPFDLDDPVNELKLFELQIQVPYSAVSSVGASLAPEVALTSKLVFRNAPATMIP